METTTLEGAFESFCRESLQHESAGRLDAAWACLEAAHIIGQRVTRLHVSSHRRMIALAWRTRDVRELFGQLSRIVAASVFTRIWVPAGNRGRATVAALSREPIPADLQPWMGDLG